MILSMCSVIWHKKCILLLDNCSRIKKNIDLSKCFLLYVNNQLSNNKLERYKLMYHTKVLKSFCTSKERWLYEIILFLEISVFCVRGQFLQLLFKRSFNLGEVCLFCVSGIFHKINLLFGYSKMFLFKFQLSLDYIIIPLSFGWYYQVLAH